MKHLINSFILTSILTLSACVSRQDNAVVETLPIYDDLFPSYHLFMPEPEQAVFALSTSAQAFVDRAINDTTRGNASLENLVQHIFAHSELGMLYRSDSNFTATEAFEYETANCLSLTIMTYAMADYAGVNVDLFEVDIPEYWTRKEGFSLLNGHINLKLSYPLVESTYIAPTTPILVDFDPLAVRNYFPTKEIGRQKLLAMYYNNKGADALIAGSYTKAYAYFRSAAKTAPNVEQTWVNLGVLYRFTENYQAAEASYKLALSLDPENLTVMENLAILYTYMGQDERGDRLLTKVNQLRVSNPFYHFMLGELAYENAEFEAALSHYQQAYSLNRRHHEILFGLGKTYFELGNMTEAELYLNQAKKRAHTPELRRLYDSKLSSLVSVN
jgi:tetratricopeptide (TPR) repeat protein